MIFAITMVRNEMPLLPLTLANLLTQGVDRVLVADHNSTDDTLNWLLCAEAADSRITVIAHETQAYNQAAVISSLARIAAASGAAWILPFDADEFWIAADPASRLSDLLGSARLEGVEAVGVTPENFAAPFDCDEFHLSDLPRFTQRCAPTELADTDDLSAFRQGLRSFVSYGWPNKLIIRASPEILIGPGAHTVPSIADAHTLGVSDAIRCLHIPLRCKRFLNTKMTHGQSLKSSGYPARHGWQNQMLVNLDSDQDLDRIWAINSYDSAGHDATAGRTEVYIPDESLAKLYHELSRHPLLNPEIASKGRAGESAGWLSTACLAVTETLMLDRETSSVELRQLRTTGIPRLEGEVASLKAGLGSVKDANRGLEDANRGLEDANRGLEVELVSLRNSRVFRWSRPVRRFYHQIVRHR